MSAIASAHDFRRRFDVSRETLDRLVLLHDLVLKWNAKINLVGRSTESELWLRHFADSAQLWGLRPASARRWADLGAGAGFPGLVVAALARDAGADTEVVLVESDTRKAVFLAEASRATGLAVSVLHHRVESLPPLAADVLSARALAPLDRLLDLTERHRTAFGMGLFPKGRTVHKELEDAARTWRFEHRAHRSITEPAAAILEIGALARV